MSLSPIKHEILETMLLNEKPEKAIDIANQLQKDFKPIMMHLIGLSRMRYVTSPQKGQYIITEKGKQALGIPETTKEVAEAILAYAPHDKAFNFYVSIDRPISMHAHTLRDFANKIERAEVASVEFHNERGDFEAWFRGLGDEELAKKAALLKQKKTNGEKLRQQLRQIVEQRYLDLAKLAEQPVPPE